MFESVKEQSLNFNKCTITVSSYIRVCSPAWIWRCTIRYAAYWWTGAVAKYKYSSTKCGLMCRQLLINMNWSAVWYLQWQWASAWDIWLWPNGRSSKKADMQIRRFWCNWHAWPKSRITRPDCGLRALQGRLKEGSPGQLNCLFREGWHLDAGDMIEGDEY